MESGSGTVLIIIPLNPKCFSMSYTDPRSSQSTHYTIAAKMSASCRNSRLECDSRLRLLLSLLLACRTGMESKGRTQPSVVSHALCASSCGCLLTVWIMRPAEKRSLLGSCLNTQEFQLHTGLDEKGVGDIFNGLVLVRGQMYVFFSLCATSPLTPTHNQKQVQQCSKAAQK